VTDETSLTDLGAVRAKMQRPTLGTTIAAMADSPECAMSFLIGLLAVAGRAVGWAA